MSWSLQFRVNHGSVVDMDRYRKDYARIADSSQEHAEQALEAVNSTLALIDSGVLGSLSEEYVVTLAGHGNPGHVSLAGWANDALSISITQV